MLNKTKLAIKFLANHIAIKFNSGIVRNYEGLIQSSDIFLEHEHAYIQWAFPTNTPSRYNSVAPTISKTDLWILYKDPDAATILKEAKRNHLKFMERFCLFLNKRQDWVEPGNHNRLRVTRMLESCYLLHGQESSAFVYDTVMKIYKSKKGDPVDISVALWYGAAHPIAE